MTSQGRFTAAAVWHDAECGSYTADLALWESLAERAGGEVLDVGAGTGRVALHLARRGHRVTALEREADLVAALRFRADGLPVTVVQADARDFDLGRTFAACLVPMQTVQLLGASGRAAFLPRARAHLQPGALLAAALAVDLIPFAAGDGPLPAPDVREHADAAYFSQPLATRDRDGCFEIERRREIVAADGTRTASQDIVRLDHLSAERLQMEGRAAGLRPAGVEEIGATHDHVASQMVMLRA